MPSSLWRRLRAAIGLLALALGSAGCVLLRPTPAPVRSFVYEPGDPAAATFALLLPGRGGHPRDYERAGFPRMLREAGFRGEVVSADAHLGYYLKRSVIRRVREDLVLPRGGRRPWIVGISMGGLGALLYEKEHPGEAAGLVLLAPYLGDPAIIAEIKRAGGLAAWEPGPIAPNDFQRELWAWIKAGGLDGVTVYIAWGESDRFAEADALLASLVRSDRVATVPGGHVWTTWVPAFEALLQRGACGVSAPR